MHHFILVELLKLVIWIGDVLTLSNERSNGELVIAFAEATETHFYFQKNPDP